MQHGASALFTNKRYHVSILTSFLIFSYCFLISFANDCCKINEWAALFEDVTQNPMLDSAVARGDQQYEQTNAETHVLDGFGEVQKHDNLIGLVKRFPSSTASCEEPRFSAQCDVFSPALCPSLISFFQYIFVIPMSI